MTRYLSTTDIAAWFDVHPRTVNKWLARYPDFPAHDAEVGSGDGRKVYGWLPGREGEIRAWERGRPGQGARRGS